MGSRLLVLVLPALVGACRMNFDPVEGSDEPGQGSGTPPATGSASQVITAQPGSDFVTACTPAQPCVVDCSAAATCIVDCNGASSCDVLCAEADCLVEARVAPACEIDCGTSIVITLGAIAVCE